MFGIRARLRGLSEAMVNTPKGKHGEVGKNLTGAKSACHLPPPGEPGHTGQSLSDGGWIFRRGVKPCGKEGKCRPDSGAVKATQEASGTLGLPLFLSGTRGHGGPPCFSHRENHQNAAAITRTARQKNAMSDKCKNRVGSYELSR